MEYLLDCLKVLYPYFGFIFLFYHSCGHNRSREGGLKTSIIRKYFGGKQPNMIETVIMGGGGFPGSYNPILATDNTHHV